MIRKVVVSGFKKFRLLECELQERALIVGPNNSGKTTLLQALATWAELGQIWLESHAGLVHDANRSFHRVEIDVASFGTLALASFEELWHNRETREPISIRVATGDWEVGFQLHYLNSRFATVGPMAETTGDDLDAFTKNPMKALYVPSLSGLDVQEPEYGEQVLAIRLAHNKGGTVLRNMVLAVSRDSVKWTTLQNTVKSLFGFELSKPSGADPILARYRHSTDDHWYDLVDGALGFLQTILVQSALLYSDATLYLVDEPDAHMHTLLKEKMYRLIREHCDENGCQALIATHSGRLIDEAANESGEKLFLVTAQGLDPVRRRDAKELLKLPAEQIVLAETLRYVLYLEGRSDLDILREWARVADHPAVDHLEGPFWIRTAEESGRNFPLRHFKTLKAQVPTLSALEVRDRNGWDGEQWHRLSPGKLRIEEVSGRTPAGMRQAFWSRYEIENYLIHPDALLRFVASSSGEDKAVEARTYMEAHLPPVLFENPFETTYNDQVTGK